MAPAEDTVKIPPTVTVPRSKALVTPVTVAEPVPFGARLTAPPKLFALSKVIPALAAVVVKLEGPPIVNTPVSVMAPAADTTKAPPTVTVPSFNGVTTPVNVALPVVCVIKVTSFEKVLALSKVIDEPPAVVVKLEVPVTVSTPPSVIAPAADTTKLPVPKVPPTVTVPRFNALVTLINVALPMLLGAKLTGPP